MTFKATLHLLKLTKTIAQKLEKINIMITSNSRLFEPGEPVICRVLENHVIDCFVCVTKLLSFLVKVKV